MRKVFLLLFMCALGTLIGSHVMKTSTIVDGILLQNVEALASVDNNLPVFCEDSGQVTCPNAGEKVGAVYIGYNWEPDEETY